MKALKSALPLIFLIVILLGALPQANSQTFYNWLENPNFSSLLNLNEDTSFESNSFASGTTYGNWTETGGSVFSSANPNTNTYHIRMQSADNLIYTFNPSYVILGADFDEFSCYADGTVGQTFRFYVYYNDSSDTHEHFTWTETGYEYFDLSSAIQTPSKYVSSVKVYQETAITSDFDDFTFSYDAGTGQTEIGMYSVPWYLGGTYPTYIDLNTVTGYQDTVSMSFSTSSLYRIYQDTPYLPASDVQYVSCYALTETDNYASVGVTCYILYSDRTTDTKTVNLSNNDTWVEVNFGQSFLDDGKYIVRVGFSCAYSGTTSLLCDNFGIWGNKADPPTRFDFSVSPEPTQQSTFSFTAYQGVVHTFTGNLYNSTGSKVENGTFIVTTDTGTSNGTITNGVFTFTLSARTGLMDYYEEIGITCDITDPASDSFATTITALWDKTGSSNNNTSSSDQIADYLGIFLVVFLPALALGGGLATNKETSSLAPMGFVAGLVIGVLMAVLTGFIPSWSLIFVGMGVIILLWGRTR